ncbi:MAG: ankyrin repeat domain-containing protein [Acidobacteriota bacterium]
MMRTFWLVVCVAAWPGCGVPSISPVASAARKGDVQAIESLVKAGQSPNGQSGVNGWTPLMHAIHTNKLESVEALLKAGADANGSCCRGLTPLILASGNGQTEIVRVLLKQGADAMHRGDDGRTALDVAIMGLSHMAGAPMGSCQAGAARELLDAAPQLRETVRLDRVVEALHKCPDIEKLMAAASR